MFTPFMDNLIENVHLVFAGFAVMSTSFALFFYQQLTKKTPNQGYPNDISENLSEGFYRSSLDGKLLRVNPAFVKLSGFSSDEEMLEKIDDLGVLWYVDPKRRDRFKELMKTKGKVSNFVSEIYHYKTKEKIWVSENARLICDPQTGEPLYFEGTARDITYEKRHNVIQERFVKLAENLPGGLFQMIRHSDNSYSVPYVSESFSKFMGLDPIIDSFDPNQYLGRIHPEDLVKYLKSLHDSGKNLAPLDEQIRLVESDGSIVWFHMTATPDRLENGDIIWHGHVNDISEYKKVELEVEQLAYFDALTGLPKRSVVEDKLISTIRSCNRRNEHAALIFLDLDNFKRLNDTHGHEVGDQLLRLVAQRLKGLIRASDVIARYGGDEFIILIDNIGQNHKEAIENVSNFASKILNSFEEGFTLGTLEHFSSPSLGIAIIDGDLPSADEIVRRADNAMYQAKKNGRNRYEFHTAIDNKDGNNVRDIQRDLNGAADRGEFRLILQPQINSDDNIIGAEAFLRWSHPEFGEILPPDFVPLAERNGTIIELNEWVINEAISTLKRWQAVPALEKLRLSVNVSVQQFSSPHFPSSLEKQLLESGIDRSLLTIELAETVLTRGVQNVANLMKKIKKTGVRFSLDDFGTGNTSITDLNILPFDELKIDGAFVSSIESNESNRSMIDGILHIARALKFETVAEHVSTDFQINFLKQRGCQSFQGYYFYAPLSKKEFEALVIKSNFKPTLKIAG